MYVLCTSSNVRFPLVGVRSIVPSLATSQYTVTTPTKFLVRWTVREALWPSGIRNWKWENGGMEVRECRSEGLASFPGSPGTRICTSSILCSGAEEPGNETSEGQEQEDWTGVS